MTVLPRDLVTVSGPDAFSFLQSLVSQDVEGMADGEARSSLLLTPKGKVTSVFRLVRVGDDAWLDLEAGHGDELRTALERFKLRVKAELGGPAEPWGMLAFRGGDAPAAPEGGALIPVDGGADVVGPRSVLTGMAQGALDAAAYEQWRIEAGIPKLGAELDESTIPQEAYLDLDAVSFTKGCFLGQELVARIDSRGHVNRLLRRLRTGDGTTALAPGAEVTVDGKSVGTVTSAVPGLALAYVRREVEPGQAATAAGTEVTVEQVPASP